MFRRAYVLLQSVASSAFDTLPQHDPTLVSLPEGVGDVRVYRNVVTTRLEQVISEELEPILIREGQKHFAKASKIEEKRVRNTQVELHGFQPFLHMKSWKSGEQKKMPGLVWSKTMLQIIDDWGKKLLGLSGEDDFHRIDTARVVEHNDPGYEMHTEHPVVGNAFLMLSLLSDTVISLDDVSTGRKGQILVPQRSLVYVGGEVRWGWRIGEEPITDGDCHVFHNVTHNLKKIVEPDLRLSISAWKFNSGMIDKRDLQDQVEELMKANKKAPEETREATAKLSTSPEGVLIPEVLCPEDVEIENNELRNDDTSGGGLLGGDLAVPVASRKQGRENSGPPKKSMGDIGKDYNSYKEHFGKVQKMMKKLQDAEGAGHIDDTWLSEARKELRLDDGVDDFGFDGNDDPEKVWDSIDEKAKLYRDKLRGMNYNRTEEDKRRDQMKDEAPQQPIDFKKAMKSIMPEGSEDLFDEALKMGKEVRKK